MTPSASPPRPITPSQYPREEGGRQSRQSAPCLSQRPPPPNGRDRVRLPFGGSTTDCDHDPNIHASTSSSTRDVILPGSWLLRSDESDHRDTDGGDASATPPLHLQLQHPPPPPRSAPPPPTQSVRILIVGDRGAGKSSLVLRFVRGAYDPDRPPRPTRGVEYSRKDVALTVPSASESVDGDEGGERKGVGAGVDVECVRVQLWELSGDHDDDAAGAGVAIDDDYSSFASSSSGTAAAVSRVLEAGGIGRDYFSAAVIVCDVVAAARGGTAAILSENVQGYVRQVREAVGDVADLEDPRSFPIVLLLNKVDAVPSEFADPCSMLYFARDVERLCGGLGISEWFPTSAATCAGLYDGFHLLIRSVLLLRRGRSHTRLAEEQGESSTRSHTDAEGRTKNDADEDEPDLCRGELRLATPSSSSSAVAAMVAYSRMFRDARGGIGTTEKGLETCPPSTGRYGSCSVS